MGLATPPPRMKIMLEFNASEIQNSGTTVSFQHFMFVFAA